MIMTLSFFIYSLTEYWVMSSFRVFREWELK